MTNAERLAQLDAERAALAAAPPTQPHTPPAPGPVAATPASHGSAGASPYPPPGYVPPAYVPPPGFAPPYQPPGYPPAMALPPATGFLVTMNIPTPMGEATALVMFGPEWAANSQAATQLIQMLVNAGWPVKTWQKKQGGKW